MKKQLVFVTFFVLVTVHMIPTAEAFIIKTITFEKAVPTISAADAAASAAAFAASKNALVDTVSKAVTEKINTLTSLVNNLVQLKVAAKKDLWRTTVNAGTGVVQSVNGIILAKPILFTKTVNVGFKPLFTTTFLPISTTATTGVVTTTTGQSSGYKYAYRSRA